MLVIQPLLRDFFLFTILFGDFTHVSFGHDCPACCLCETMLQILSPGDKMITSCKRLPSTVEPQEPSTRTYWPCMHPTMKMISLRNNVPSYEKLTNQVSCLMLFAGNTLMIVRAFIYLSLCQVRQNNKSSLMCLHLSCAKPVMRLVVKRVSNFLETIATQMRIQDLVGEGAASEAKSC